MLKKKFRLTAAMGCAATLSWLWIAAPAMGLAPMSQSDIEPTSSMRPAGASDAAESTKAPVSDQEKKHSPASRSLSVIQGERRTTKGPVGRNVIIVHEKAAESAGPGKGNNE